MLSRYNKKNILIVTIGLILLITSVLIAVGLSQLNISESKSYITNSGWTTIATTNAIMVSALEVISSPSNQDELYIRVLDDNGAIICDAEKIANGEKSFLKKNRFQALKIY